MAAFRIQCLLRELNRIQPKEKEAMETPARHIIRASFFRERIQRIVFFDAVPPIIVL